MAKIQLKPSLSARRTPVETKTTGKKQAPVVKKSDIPGLTLSQIRKATPKYILNNSNEVVISSLKQKATKTGLPGVIAKPVSVGMKGRKILYTATVVGKDKDYPLYHRSQKVMVSCSCDFFMYYCLSGDTKVLTDSGYHSIESLAQPRSNKLPITYMVDGKPYKGSAPVLTGYKKTITIHLKNGRHITCTKDHKLFTYNSSTKDLSGEEKPAGSIVPGDRLIIDNSAPALKRPKFNKEFYEAFFLGVMMGDGTFLNNKPRLVLYGDKRHTILPLLIKAKVVKSYKDISCKHYTADAIELSKTAYSILEKYSYTHKTSVDITSDTQLYGYLSGLISTDGCVTKKQINLSGNKDTLSQLLDYLGQYGHNFCSLIKAYSKGDYSNLGLRKSDVYLLCMSSVTLAQLKGKLNLGHIKQDKFDNIVLKPFNRIPCSTVTRIVENKPENVYDITVPKLNKFVANGIVVHNCEFALTRWHAATIKYSNGQPASVTNPSNVPMVCKHLAHLFDVIKDHGF